MTKQNSLMFRILWFIAGLAVISVACGVFWPLVVVSGFPRACYFWVCIYLVYIIFFAPFCFVTVSKKNVDKAVPLFVVGWQFIVPTVIVGLVQAFLVLFSIISIGLGLLIFFVMILILSIGLFLICVTSTTMKAVEGEEKQTLGLLMQIRSSMDVLVLKTAALPNNNFEERMKIQNLDETVNLMAPVNTIDAAKLEQEILMNVTRISSMCDSVIAGSSDEDFKKALAVLENQIRERKLKRSM